MKLLDTSILFKEVSASSLGILRLLFGFILLEDFVNFHDYFVYYLEPSKFYSTYDFFHWMQMQCVSWGKNIPPVRYVQCCCAFDQLL